MKNKQQRLKAIGATAIILASSMATEAGKVSMMLNGVPQGDFNENRTNAASSGTKSGVQLYMLNGVPQGGASTSSETLSRIKSTNQAIELYNLGQEQAESKQFEASLNSFDELLLANPEYAEAHHGKGYSLAQLKRHEEAVKSFDEALKYQSDFAMCHYNRACALQDLGKIEEARDGFKVAVGLNPEYQKQSRASKILQEKQDVAASEPAISVNVDQPALSNIRQSERREDTAESLRQKKLSIINAKQSVLGHWFASIGDHLRSGRLADATNSLDSALELLHDYPSLRGNETRDVDTQTTLSMLSASEISTQTENESKEIAVQVSSSMTSASMQTESVPISTSFAQTDSSTIGATEIATQTHIVNSNQETQTLASQLNDSFSQTESEQEHVKQIEISTSTDDLFVLGPDDSHSDILDWEVSSHASSESDESLYFEDEEEEQVLSDVSQQILSKDNSDFYKTVAEIDEMLASDLAEEATYVLAANNNVELQRLQALESEKTALINQSMELASYSTRNMTGSIISDIDKRLSSASSLSVVSAGEEDEQLGSSVGGNSGFYISPFIGKALQQERASHSGYHSNIRGAIICRSQDLILQTL